jgi:hypothetical protein
MPIFFSVPASGSALLTFAAPGDPSDSDWERVTQIVCRVVGTEIEVEGLFGRPLACAAVGAAMAAGDVFSDGQG